MDKASALKILPFLLLLVCVTSCDTCSKEHQRLEVAPQPEIPQLSWEPPQALDLRDPGSFTEHRLRLAEPANQPDCHVLLEPDGEPRTWPWLMDESAQAGALFGCQLEAYERHENGRRYVAYGVPIRGSERGRDLRFVAYDSNGEVRWARLMNRTKHEETFVANLRGSFIALLEPRHACVGTLWQGGTQILCVEEESGEIVHAGTMSFWSGVALRGRNQSLYGADINGLTRRYPYTGLEMRHRPVHGTGGRAAFYASSEEALFFAPSSDGPVKLGKYGFDEMSALWMLSLPTRPLVSWRHNSDEHNRLLIKIDETIYGIDTESGVVSWALEVGSDLPPVAISPDSIYLLLRRDTEANLLYALDPKSGQVQWYAPTPTGTLHVGWFEGVLMLRSVRAVREVLFHAPPVTRDDDGH